MAKKTRTKKMTSAKKMSMAERVEAEAAKHRQTQAKEREDLETECVHILVAFERRGTALT